MQALINVDVDDLDRATRFDKTAFGLKVGRRFGVDGVEMLGSSALTLVTAVDPLLTDARVGFRASDSLRLMKYAAAVR